MPADEVLTRLGDIARADFTAFTNEQGELDLKAARDAGLFRLVRRITRSAKGTVTVEF